MIIINRACLFHRRRLVKGEYALMDFNEMGKKKRTNKERKARKEEQMKNSDIYQKKKKFLIRVASKRTTYL